jgi:hypothetical protein
MSDRLPCALCMIDGVTSESADGWPWSPICEAHVIACGGFIEKPSQDAEACVVPPQRARPILTVIDGGRR